MNKITKLIVRNKAWKINKEYNKEKLLYLLIDRPDRIIRFDPSFIWHIKYNEVHREYDLPAVILKSGDFLWYKNGKCYRQK